VDDFGFVVEKEDLVQRYNDYVPPLEIWFCSPRCRVRVWQDTGAVRTELAPGSAGDETGEWLPLGYVKQWLHPEVQSANPIPPLEFSNDWQNDVDKALADESYYLRRYCRDVLRGDFSLKPVSINVPRLPDEKR
jgi:hypothetical protein